MIAALVLLGVLLAPTLFMAMVLPLGIAGDIVNSIVARRRVP